jgi:patatin-like phospholipase/acyl hydrolase
MCQLFDLIGGTSTGGVIASLLGIRGFNAQRCEDLYLDLCGKVFAHHESEAASWTTRWSRMVGGMNIIRVNCG